ncbi:hypothetical protein D3C81_2026700 [compost metagenome]
MACAFHAVGCSDIRCGIMLRIASPALAKDSIATTPVTRSPSLSAVNSAVAAP